MAQAMIGELPARYQAPQLTVYGSVAMLTAGGSKPGNEAGPTCPGNNQGNVRGNNSNNCTPLP